MAAWLELRAALLQLRGQAVKAWLFALCLSLGVAARVSVGSFMGAVEKALAGEARNLLTADLEISGLSPLSPSQQKELELLAPPGSRFQRRASFLSVVAGSDGKASKLCQVLAVEGSYPFYGNLRIRAGDGTLVHGLPGGFGRGEALFTAQQGLFSALGQGAAESIRFGRTRLKAVGVLEEEPGLGSGAFSLGPTLIVPLSQLEASRLAGFGSRITYQTMVSVQDPAQAAPLKAALMKEWRLGEIFSFQGEPPPARSLRIKTYMDAEGEIRSFFDRLADFLRLASLLALLLGGVGAAAVLSGFVREQVPQLGVMRVLGASSGQLLRFVAYQCLFLGFLGSLLGIALGAASQYVLPGLLKDFLPVALNPALDPASVAGGALLGLFFSSGFSLLGVLGTLGASPSSLLRDDPEETGGWRLALLAALFFLATMALASLEARSWQRGSGFVAALGLGALLFSLAGRPLRALASRLPLPWPGPRHGLANLSRPGTKPGPALVALACAALVLGVLSVYQHSLLRELDPSRRGDDMPGLFLIDIQRDQLEGLASFSAGEGLPQARLSPMVKGRYLGKAGSELGSEGGAWTREKESGRRLSRREQNLSWRRELSKGEKIVAGKWMDPDGELLEASLEERFADRLEVKVGDTLRFDVSGMALEAKVTSLRKVHWASFQPNFFILLSPWAIEDAPQTWIGSLNGLSEAQRRAAQSGIAARFPNITSIDVAEGAKKAMSLMAKISDAIRAVAYFALASGLLVLFGIALAAARARRTEAALLKTLGAGPLTLAASLIAEFGALGLLSALMGLSLSLAFGWVLLTQFINIPFTAPWVPLSQMGLFLTLASASAGTLACLGAIRVRPLEVLREE